jgi:ribonuclease PH
MRPVSFKTSYLKNPAGSCLASYGDTVVLCTATVEKKVPPFLEGTGQGWVSAEYAMLPGSTPGGRKRRETLKPDGRSVEIKRLIGRSLRAAVDMNMLGELSVMIDCDVLQADGGTRTAAISGGWVALWEALHSLGLTEQPGCIQGRVGAVSAGIVDGKVICDLDYKLDSRAEVDMNVVKLESAYVEVQGTGERNTFDRTRLDEILNAADQGLEIIFREQQKTISSAIDPGLKK